MSKAKKMTLDQIAVKAFKAVENDIIKFRGGQFDEPLDGDQTEELAKCFLYYVDQLEGNN